MSNRPLPRICSSPAITSIVADRLCGSIPITTTDWSMPCSHLELFEQGGQRYFELGKPLLSHSRPSGAEPGVAQAK